MKKQENATTSNFLQNLYPIVCRSRLRARTSLTLALKGKSRFFLLLSGTETFLKADPCDNEEFHDMHILTHDNNASEGNTGKYSFAEYKYMDDPVPELFMELEPSPLPLPDAEEYAEQQGFVEALADLATSEHYDVFTLRDGVWEQSLRPWALLRSQVPGAFPGNWGVVATIQPPYEALVTEDDFDELTQEDSVAGALMISGLVPKGVDKVIAASVPSYRHEWNRLVYGNLPAPVLYSQDPELPSIFPTEAFDLEDTRPVCLLSDPMLSPYRITSRLVPIPEQRKIIEAYYIHIWQRRLSRELTWIAGSCVPTSTDEEFSLEEALMICSALHPDGEGAFPNLAKIARAKTPMPENARAFIGDNILPVPNGKFISDLEKSRDEAELLSRVLDIWQHLMESHGIRFDERWSGGDVEKRAVAIRKVGEGLGIYDAVESHLKGSSLESSS